MRHLPRDSATARAILGPAAADYTNEVEALDWIAFFLATGNWQRAGGKGERPKKPKRPRPRRIDN